MPREDCPLCGGTGWKVVERPDPRDEKKLAVVADRPFPGVEAPPAGWRVAVRCECTESDRERRLMELTRIPRRYEHCDFANFDTDLNYENSSTDAWSRSLRQARLQVEAFAREYPFGTEHGLMLMGPCGCGKTHLAVAALKEIVRRGHGGLFYDYRELLKEIQASYKPDTATSELDVLEPVLQAEVLLLDDLGAMKPSAWVMETVGHILNSRYNDKKITVITTNFLDVEASPVAPIARQAFTDDSLTDRIGQRIRSRLYEMCQTIEVSAPDYRKEVRKAGYFRA